MVEITAGRSDCNLTIRPPFKPLFVPTPGFNRLHLYAKSVARKRVERLPLNGPEPTTPNSRERYPFVCNSCAHVSGLRAISRYAAVEAKAFDVRDSQLIE